MKYETVIQDLRAVHEAQGRAGNWDHDPYMQGLYNGLELALAMFEGRAPEFKESPEVWGKDSPIEYILAKEE